MKQFRFKLQSVLDIRTREADHIRLQVAMEEQACQHIRSDIEAIHYEISTLKVPPPEAPTGWSSTLLVSAGHYLQRLKFQEAQQLHALKKQELRLSQVKEVLKQAHQKQRALERLKERQQADRQLWILGEEEKQLADVVQARQTHTRQ